MIQFYRFSSFLTFLTAFGCNVFLIAQQNPYLQQQNFLVGSWLTRNLDQDIIDSFASTGMDNVICSADEVTYPFLGEYGVFADNGHTALDYVPFYAMSFYSKWEAEDQTEPDKSRVQDISMGKGIIGKMTRAGQAERHHHPAGSLLYGPHYRRKKI